MRTGVFTLLACCLASTAAWSIECQDRPGLPSTGWWAWREIESRKCWFIKTGAMPPKSELHWRAREQGEVRPPEPAVPLAAGGETPTPSSPREEKPPIETSVLGRFTTTRAKPVSGPAPRLLGGRVDLMDSTPLSSIHVLEGRRGKPASADSFDARFTGSDARRP
jgi:hypothetical protein